MKKSCCRLLDLHPLAIDDALHETHIPKVEVIGNSIYTLPCMPSVSPVVRTIEGIEWDIFLGDNYIVTHHDFPIQALDRVWNACTKDVRYFKRGADHVLYKLTPIRVDRGLYAGGGRPWMKKLRSLRMMSWEDPRPRSSSAYLSSSVPPCICAGCYLRCARC